MKKLLLLSCLGFMTALPVSAQETNLELAHKNIGCTSLFDGLITSLATQASQMGADKQAATAKLSTPESRAKFMNIIANNMAQSFSNAELKALTNFNCSPEGRGIMAKMPDVMKQAYPQLMAEALKTVAVPK